MGHDSRAGNVEKASELGQPPRHNPGRPGDKRSIASQFFRYVSLNTLGMVGISVYILADTFFIANGVGADGLTALNFAIVVYAVMQALGLLFGIGGATQFQFFRASGAEREGNRVFTNTLYMVAAAAVLLMVVGVVFATPVAYVLGADGDTVGYTVVYLQTVFSFAPFFLLNNVLLPFVRNDSSPQLAMAAMVVGSLANILMDYVFVFVFGWGMFGAAFATGLSPIISLGILSFHFIRRRNSFRPVKAMPDIHFMGKVVVLGFSSFVVELSASLVLFVFNLVILFFEGNTGVAAYGIVANLAFVANALFVGIAQGIQPLASKSYARKSASDLKQVLRYTIVTALVIAAALYLVIGIAAEPLATAFNRDGIPQLNQLAVEGMRIYFIGYLFAGVNIVSAAFFSAVNQPGRGLLISLTRGFIAILGFVFLFSSVFGMLGVWFSFPAAECLTACLTGYSLYRFNRSLKEVHVR